MNEMQNKQHSGSKEVQSVGVHASNNKNPESEDEDNPLKASDMKELKHPANTMYQNELNLEDEMKASEEEYHKTLLHETTRVLATTGAKSVFW